MVVLEHLKGISRLFKIQRYSDRSNTDLENGIEYGFGFVLGVSSAVLMVLLLFFVLILMPIPHSKEDFLVIYFLLM